LLRVEKNSAGSEWSPGSERERAAARERGTDSREAALYSLAARGADFLLGKLRDEAGLDDEREVRETALAEDLAVAEGEGVDDGDELAGLLREVGLLRGGDERPQLIDVDGRAVVRVARQVEVAHTDLTEVTVGGGEVPMGARVSALLETTAKGHAPAGLPAARRVGLG
jgi:hypothetical protein